MWLTVSRKTAKNLVVRRKKVNRIYVKTVVMLCLVSWLMRPRQLNSLPWYRKEMQLAQASLDSQPGSLTRQTAIVCFS